MAQNISETPPTVTLSGLQPSGSSFSGASQGQSGLSGADEYAKSPFGQQGGPSLSELLALFAQGGGGEVGAGGDILQSLSQGSLGQQTGGLSAGSFGQTQPGYQPAQQGGGGGQQYAAGQSSGNTADPLALASKFLGLAKTGVGIASQVNSAGVDLGTQTDISGFTPEQQQAYQTYRQGERQDFTASPYNMAGQSPFMTGETGLGPDANQIAGEMSGGYEGGYGGAAGSGFGSFPGETMGEMGSAGGLTLGTGAGDTNWLGAGMGAAGAGSGLMNLLKAFESGNAGQGVGGGLQSVGGLASMLKNIPELSGALGMSGDALGAVGAGVGGLGGLLGIATGAQSGNPVQIAQGLYSMLPAINSLAGTASGAAMLAELGLGSLPAAATATTAATAGTGALGAMAPILSAASAFALPVAFVVQALTDSLQQMERDRVMNAGFTNNPIKGELYSQATEGVGKANEGLAQLGDTGTADTNSLIQQLLQSTQNLMPYYATAQGGRGAIRASDTITGRGADWAAKPYEGGLTPEQYTQNFTNANQGMAGIVNELMRRGMTYQQLGQLPVSGDWASQTLDAGNTPDEMFARNYATNAPGQNESRWAEGLRLSGPLMKPGAEPSGSPFGGADWLLNESLGTAMTAPDSIGHASGNMTGMYGGPLWAALARMGVPELMPLINQNFDPWFSARTWDPATRQAHYAEETAAQQGLPGSENLFVGQGKPLSRVTAQDLANAQGAGTIGASQVFDPASGKMVYTSGNERPMSQAEFDAQQAQRTVAAPDTSWMQWGGPQQFAPQMQQQMAQQASMQQSQQIDPAMLQQLLAMANSPAATTSMAPRGGAAEEETLLELLKRISFQGGQGF